MEYREFLSLASRGGGHCSSSSDFLLIIRLPHMAKSFAKLCFKSSKGRKKLFLQNDVLLFCTTFIIKCINILFWSLEQKDQFVIDLTLTLSYSEHQPHSLYEQVE